MLDLLLKNLSDLSKGMKLLLPGTCSRGTSWTCIFHQRTTNNQMGMRHL